MNDLVTPGPERHLVLNGSGVAAKNTLKESFVLGLSPGPACANSCPSKPEGWGKRELGSGPHGIALRRRKL
jgi:hypothetical protein